MNQADLSTLTACAHTLEALALDMRQSGSVGGRGLVWDEEMDRVEYERVKGLAGRVREICGRGGA